jgi:hypothetical protein
MFIVRSLLLKTRHLLNHRDGGLRRSERNDRHTPSLRQSHLCNSGPCCNPAHILLKTSERNQIRKQHQHGRLPCDCEVPCLRNGLVWYIGEEKGVNTHLNLRHEIRQKELDGGVVEKISRYNENAREKAAGLGAEHDDFVPRPNKINTAISPTSKGQILRFALCFAGVGRSYSR